MHSSSTKVTVFSDGRRQRRQRRRGCGGCCDGRGAYCFCGRHSRQALSFKFLSTQALQLRQE